jgi:two-component system LytT family response regulator
MSRLKALIVDDEQKSVELLHQLLIDTHQFSEVKTALSGFEAKNHLLTYQPNLIFLDIKMPEMDGFTFLEELNDDEGIGDVIFVTAYEEYALKAIKKHAFDYLLKPIDRQELLDCILQYKDRKTSTGLLHRIEKLVHEPKDHRMRINTRTGYLLIDPHQILYCKADGNYTYIDLGDRQHLCSLQLGMVEEELPSNCFIRLGRSLIVNRALISKVDRKTGQVTFEKEHKTFTLALSHSQLKELDASQDT